jgi:hypothetical protein
VVARGEKPIELRDSWFFAKSIEVERYSKERGVEHCMGKGGPKPYRLQGNSEYPFHFKLELKIINQFPRKHPLFGGTESIPQNSRQTLSAKVQSQEGNSPDRLLRSPRKS